MKRYVNAIPITILSKSNLVYSRFVMAINAEPYILTGYDMAGFTNIFVHVVSSFY